MARMCRAEVFDPGEVAVAHVFSRTVRRCFLMGDDPISGKNFDHRKRWIEEYLQQFAAYFGIDLLCFSLLSNHFHLILRSRPDVGRRGSRSPVVDAVPASPQTRWHGHGTDSA